MTMTNRSAPNVAPGIVLTTLEVTLVDRLVKDKPSRNSDPNSLTDYLAKIAQFGGLSRAAEIDPQATRSCGEA